MITIFRLTLSSFFSDLWTNLYSYHTGKTKIRLYRVMSRCIVLDIPDEQEAGWFISYGEAVNRCRQFTIDSACDYTEYYVDHEDAWL